MKLVVNLKLKPTPEQSLALRETLEQCNSACDWLSRVGWEKRVLRQYDLHKLAYRDVREKFHLAAQVAVRCIAKVADAYKLDKKTVRKFRKHAAQPFDDRIFGFKPDDVISIWAITGRLKIPFVCGDRQRALLAFRKGEVDLMLVRDKWYIAVICDVDEPEFFTPKGILGIDCGIVNIATNSDGIEYSGEGIERSRRKFTHRRHNLQRKGTRSAKRKLQKISGTQARFQRNVNHVVSKRIVQTAERTSRAIALEDLTGIRQRVTANRRQRARLSNWGFAQLQSFVSYKSRLSGIPLFFVDPRYTSQTCPSCGLIDKRNRPERDKFSCVRCGTVGHSDHIAAINIARAAVNQPMVTSELHLAPQLQAVAFRRQ